MNEKRYFALLQIIIELKEPKPVGFEEAKNMAEAEAVRRGLFVGSVWSAVPKGNRLDAPDRPEAADGL